MGAKLAKEVAESDLSRLLAKAGLERVYQGKVRDTYSLPDHPDLLLVVATDRLSIFDFVLFCLVPDKGEILTALTVFWLTKILQDIDHHLVAYGRKIEQYLSTTLHSNSELQARALIVRKLNIIPVECVARGYLTGSGWRSYQENRTICCQRLPEGLHDGVKLPPLFFPLFTPATKAESGHDEPLDPLSVAEKYGLELERLTSCFYRRASSYASSCGIIVADTKFEFGGDSVLADEVLTPDSSRFWDKKEWDKAVAQRRAPTGYDKEPVRQWGRTVPTPFEGLVGINNLDTENPDHLAFVHQQEVLQEIISATTQRYREIFRRLTDCELEAFQKNIMGVSKTT